jgi:predicted deacylase
VTGASGAVPPFAIADLHVRPGHRAKIELPIARLMSGTPVALPAVVLHGTQTGPTVWLSAAIHGDEICGVEIIRRVLERTDPANLAGTLIAVPVVNVHGFNAGDRYLPDRRDLNRSFPGSARGSLASRVAHLMMTEVIDRCDIGIDLHTGSDHRINLPQIRGDLDNPAVRDLAAVFAAPISLHSRTRDGSLREAATESGATALLFEGGEADRFDPSAIAAGTNGVLRVLAAAGMVESAPKAKTQTKWSRKSVWMRASNSGMLQLSVRLGDEVAKGERIATIYDPFGKRLGAVSSRSTGVVVGHTQRPLVNRGDAIVHLAEVGELEHPESA